jgi:AcrR family transcriptional regulator
LAVNRDGASGASKPSASEAGAETRQEAASPARGGGPDAVSGSPRADRGDADEADGRAVRAQARREQRRSTILAAATQVFKDKGYHATSVNDIIDAAQIARGTFYLYFTSKRDVFAELSSTFLALIRGSVRKISLDPGDGEPLAQMRANFRRVMNTVLEHSDLATIMLRGDAGDAEARAQMAPFYDQVIDLIGQAMRVGRSLGIARDCDDEVIAVAALAGLKEVLGRMLEARQLRPEGDLAASTPGEVPENAVPVEGPVAAGGRGGDAIWRTSPERLADELLTFFVRGVFTRGHALG